VERSSHETAMRTIVALALLIAGCEPQAEDLGKPDIDVWVPVPPPFELGDMGETRDTGDTGDDNGCDGEQS